MTPTVNLLYIQHSTPLDSTLLYFTSPTSSPFHSIPLYSTLLHSTLLYFSSLYFTLLYFTLLYSNLPPLTLLSSTLLHFTPLCFTSLHFTSLHSSLLYWVLYSILFCSAFYSILSFFNRSVSVASKFHPSLEIRTICEVTICFMLFSCFCHMLGYFSKCQVRI